MGGLRGLFAVRLGGQIKNPENGLELFSPQLDRVGCPPQLYPHDYPSWRFKL